MTVAVEVGFVEKANMGLTLQNRTLMYLHLKKNPAAAAAVAVADIVVV